jgi:hypothetical protein
MARLAYKAVRATEPGSSHSQSRVVASLWNSAAIRRRMSAHLPQARGRRMLSRGGEGEEGLLQVAALGGELVQLDSLGEREVTDLGGGVLDHVLDRLRGASAASPAAPDVSGRSPSG